MLLWLGKKQIISLPSQLVRALPLTPTRMQPCNAAGQGTGSVEIYKLSSCCLWVIFSLQSAHHRAVWMSGGMVLSPAW